MSAAVQEPDLSPEDDETFKNLTASLRDQAASEFKITEAGMLISATQGILFDLGELLAVAPSPNGGAVLISCRGVSVSTLLDAELVALEIAKHFDEDA